MFCSSLLLRKIYWSWEIISVSLPLVKDWYFRKKEKRIQDLPTKSHSESSDCNALFWLQDQCKMKGKNNFIYTKDIEKQKTKEGNLWHGNLTGSHSQFSLLKIRARKSRFRPSSPPKWGRMSCSLMHSPSSTAVAWELHLSSIQSPVVIYLLSATLFILTGNSLSPDWHVLVKLIETKCPAVTVWLASHIAKG